jgi:predicted tellurium resistance membrane protein TerC
VEAAIALITLAAMEIVLGIDNLVFISILTARLPKDQQPLARKLGLGMALGTRILLLLSLSYVMSMTQPLFHVSPMLEAVGLPSQWIKGEVHESERHEHDTEAASESDNGKVHESADAISVNDLILLAGGLFLLGKSVLEIHHKVDGQSGHHASGGTANFTAVLIQVAAFDILFSLDSVITAVGMANQIWVMVTAVIIAIGVMIVFANPVGNFVEKHPTITILALSFLILIGVLLVAEGLGQHLNKGYIYFAMAFSLIVEMLNMRVRSITSKSKPETHVAG